MNRTGRRRRSWSLLLLFPAAVTMALLVGGGLGWALWESLREPGSFRAAFTHPGFLPGLAVSLWIAAASTLISTLLALPLALWIAARGATRRQWLALWLPLPVPHVIAAVMVGLLLGSGSVLQRLLGVEPPFSIYGPWAAGAILAFVWKEVPFISIFLLGHLASLPRDLTRTAAGLGASSWQTVRWVLWPLLRPSVVVAAGIVFLFSFAAYEVPFLFGISHPLPLPVLAHQFYLSADPAARPVALALDLLMALCSALLACVLFALWRAAQARRGQAPGAVPRAETTEDPA